MPEPLDALDVRILEILQEDASLPINDIADRVASSKSVVWRRLQKLIDNGVVRKRVALLDAHKLGLGVMIFAQIKMARHDHDVLPNFVKAIQRFPQVVECHTLMGNVDFLLKVVVRDIDEYEEVLWHKLSKINGVLEIHSLISMTRFVDTTALPLDSVLLK